MFPCSNPSFTSSPRWFLVSQSLEVSRAQLGIGQPEGISHWAPVELLFGVPSTYPQQVFAPGHLWGWEDL